MEQEFDLTYICTTVGNLTSIPIRLYQKHELIFYHSSVWLPKDPVVLCQKEIFQIRDHVGYFVTSHFHYYGIVNYKDFQIVLGPTRQTSGTEQELRELAFQADVSAEDVDDFVSGMKSILRMPLDSILMTLCSINYSLNREKLTLSDLTFYDTQQEELTSEMTARQFDASALPGSEELDLEQDIHNTLTVEQSVMNIIRHGDSAALAELLPRLPAVRAGLMSSSQLRQAKNTFIVTATLASRAAIQGGMETEEALSLSDAFIQKCEQLQDMNRISNLSYHMIQYYTEHVGCLRIGKNDSKLAAEVANYVRHHLSQAITTEDIARHLYISRPHLSSRFREETGMTLTDYIMKEKTKEAKHLLRYTDKSLLAISTYLGFSSQSHFSRVFKKYTGSTPGEYRDKYQN